MDLNEERKIITHAVDHVLKCLETDRNLADDVLTYKERRQRRHTPLFALAAALTMTVIAVAVAETAGLHVFPWFTQRVDNMDQMLAYAVPTQEPPLIIETEELGESTASFPDVYYDGYTLMAGLVVENGYRLEEYHPDDESLTGMRQFSAPAIYGLDDRAPLYAQWINAVNSGIPFGLKYSSIRGCPQIQVDLQDQIITYWQMYTGISGEQNSTALFEVIKAMVDPQDEMMEMVTVQVDFDIVTELYWFDGQHIWYQNLAHRCLNQMIRTDIHRAQIKTGRYTGMGTMHGKKVSVTANVSENMMNVSWTVEDGAFPELTDGRYYDLVLRDEQGTMYWPRGVFEYSWQHEEGSYRISREDGTLPEHLEACVIIGQNSMHIHEGVLPENAQVIRLDLAD